MATVASDELAAYRTRAMLPAYVSIHSRAKGPFTLGALDANSNDLVKLTDEAGVSGALASVDVHFTLADGRKGAINLLPLQAGTVDLADIRGGDA